MKTIVLFFCLLFSGLSFSHSEVVARVTISEYKKELGVRAVLEKRHLAGILKKEANCSADKMMEICGSNYFLKHFQLSINNEPVNLSKQHYELQKENVVFLFGTEWSGKILQSITVKSDYMMSFNDHSVLRILIQVKDKNTSYNINHHRSTITSNF